MKNYNFKVNHILAIATVSAAMMGVTTALNNVSTVHADAINDSTVANTNDNIVTGTWGTASWTWNKTTGEMTIGGGNTNYVVDAPWIKYSRMQNIKKITIIGKLSLPYDSTGLFNRLYEVKCIEGLDKVDTSSVRIMKGLFARMPKLSSVDLSHFDTSNVTDMSDMFQGDTSLKNLNVNSFDTSKVTNMSGMFDGMRSLTNLDLSNFNTSNVTRMDSMFENMDSLQGLNVSRFNTSRVIYMHSMFNGNGMKNLDLSNFDTSNVIAMTNMFANTKMNSINLDCFNTSKVTNMQGMFENSTLSNLNLSSFDTSEVKDMSRMFCSTAGLKDLDLSSFDTSKVTDMNCMFKDMSGLQSLNLSSFNTSKVDNMNSMFKNIKIKCLDIDNFDMSKVLLFNDMFGKNSYINTIVLGLKNKFEKDVNLFDVPTTNDYLGKWQNVKDSNGDKISNGNLYTSDDLMTNYTPGKAGTYVWTKKSDDVSDLKDLYNKVKLSISYSDGIFNSQPGNSMEYSEEFNDKSMFGAMDYAYNSNKYNQLLNLMHKTVKKTHESIGSLQVNESKANELGLNVDQLKSDLTKDSVPYDYSQDNDINGINKQLDSFVSTRDKYNKLVQQGVFDKSDYWTMNK